MIMLPNVPFLRVLPQSSATDSGGQQIAHLCLSHHMGISSPPALGIPPTIVPCLQWMSPNVSVLWSWVTRSILEQSSLWCEVAQDVWSYLYRSISAVPPSAGGHLGTFLSGLSFPNGVELQLETFFLPSWGTWSPEAGRALMTGGAPMAGGTPAVGGVTHPFHSFLKDHSYHKGSLLGIPCKCHHLLIGPFVGDSNSCVRIMPGIIGLHLHLPASLAVWVAMFKPEVLFYKIQNLLMKPLCHLLLTPASARQAT